MSEDCKIFRLFFYTWFSLHIKIWDMYNKFVCDFLCDYFYYFY